MLLCIHYYLILCSQELSSFLLFRFLPKNGFPSSFPSLILHWVFKDTHNPAVPALCQKDIFSQWNFTKRNLHTSSHKHPIGKSRGWDASSSGQVVLVLERLRESQPSLRSVTGKVFVWKLFTVSWQPVFMPFSCCLEGVALFPGPIHSWPALRLLSQIKIVTGAALTPGLNIASYFGWRRRWTCFTAGMNVSVLRLWNFGKALETHSQRSTGQSSPAEWVNRNEFIITEYSSFFTVLIEVFQKGRELKTIQKCLLFFQGHLLRPLQWEERMFIKNNIKTLF